MYLTTQGTTWSKSVETSLLLCLNLLNINTVLYFSIPKEYILFQHIFFFSLTKKKSFIFSQKMLWRYTYISVSLFHTHKESRHHLFISGEIWKSQDSKHSSSGNFERKNMLLFLPASPFPEIFAFHSQLHGQLHGFCRTLTHRNTQLHFLLFYSEHVCTLVLLLLLFFFFFSFSFHITYWFVGSIICFWWGRMQLEVTKKTNNSSWQPQLSAITWDSPGICALRIPLPHTPCHLA